eukprot:scaffold99634_cov60-Phaeocystis_antarctica.AAC.3
MLVRRGFPPLNRLKPEPRGPLRSAPRRGVVGGIRLLTAELGACTFADQSLRTGLVPFSP